MDAPWYNEGMNRYEFRIKFDSDRELFVLLVRLCEQRLSDQTNASEYFECTNITTVEPYEFHVCLPLSAIPDQFAPLKARFCVERGQDLGDAVRLISIRCTNPHLCFSFEFDEAALLEITPPIYRNWIASVIKAGHFYDLFPRF